MPAKISRHHTEYSERMFYTGRTYIHETNPTGLFRVRMTDYKTMKTSYSIDWLALFITVGFVVSAGYLIGYAVHNWL